VFERLLVPLDGTALAEEAVPVALAIPSRRIRLLHVRPAAPIPIRDRAEAGAATLAAPRLGRAHAAKRYLEAWGEEFRRQGRDVEIAIERGDPAERIVAASGDANLVAMATRGPDVIHRALVGSVAERVVRHAGAPTLLVRAGQGSLGSWPARIVVPLDGSPVAEEALPVAAALGDTLALPLHLVRVVNRAWTLVPAAAWHEAADGYLAEHVRRLGAHNAGAASEVRFGAVAASLLDAIQPSDLVVMATRGRGGLWRWLLGSVTERLVRSSPAPIVLVRAGTAVQGSRGDSRRIGVEHSAAAGGRTR
jgi:nucleotide-binding universal stress UspA family protein